MRALAWPAVGHVAAAYKWPFGRLCQQVAARTGSIHAHVCMHRRAARSSVQACALAPTSKCRTACTHGLRSVYADALAHALLVIACMCLCATRAMGSRQTAGWLQ